MKILTKIFPLIVCIIFTACSSKQNNIPQTVQAGVTENTISLTQNIVSTLKNQAGKSYKLGGTSPATGFDCSGLIYWAYKQHGIDVPRISYEQAKAGREVAKNKLRPGDILIFKSGNSPNGLHTATYLGNNQFIHAPNARKKVKIETLAGGYWAKHFIQARRIVDANLAEK